MFLFRSQKLTIAKGATEQEIEKKQKIYGMLIFNNIYLVFINIYQYSHKRTFGGVT